MLTDRVEAAVLVAALFISLAVIAGAVLNLAETLSTRDLTTTENVIDCMQDRDERRTK